MQTLVERGCGLDVHQATVVACLLTVLQSGKVHKQVGTFGTTTRELVSLREWLLSEGCTHVAMESTGVYWKSVYAILEGAFEIVVANAQHVKKVPGRKTDVKDAEWIADLLCHGLLRASFVPPKPIRELRDLTRYRRKLVESRSAERNRLLKVRSRKGSCARRKPRSEKRRKEFRLRTPQRIRHSKRNTRLEEQNQILREHDLFSVRLRNANIPRRLPDMFYPLRFENGKLFYRDSREQWHEETSIQPQVKWQSVEWDATGTDTGSMEAMPTIPAVVFLGFVNGQHQCKPAGPEA